MSRSDSRHWRHALFGPVLVGLVSLVITTGATSAGARAAAPVSYVSSTIPDSAVGAQFRWLLSAARHQPIAVAAIEAHFSRDFLDQVTPAQLNSALADGADASRARFDGVISTGPGTLEAAVQLGPNGPRHVISMGVDNNGQISELNFKSIPLRSRAALHMAPVSLPIPTGKNTLGTETIVVNNGTSAGRDIPVQLWYPTTAQDSTAGTDAPYAPAATSLFLAQQLAVPARDISAVTTHATKSSPVKTAEDRLPIVLVSPGQGITRTVYSGLSAELASHGYFVAVLDHPGDGLLVEYPDGHTVPQEEASEDARVAVRVADARAILDHLKVLDADATQPVPRCARSRTGRVRGPLPRWSSRRRNHARRRSLRRGRQPRRNALRRRDHDRLGPAVSSREQ